MLNSGFVKIPPLTILIAGLSNGKYQMESPFMVQVQ